MTPSTTRLQFPPDLYGILLSVWRSSAYRRGTRPGQGGHAGGLSPDELYAVSRKVRELSRGFTRDRALAGERYLSDPDLLGAYLLHFWPISYAQALLGITMMRRARRAMTAATAGGILAGAARGIAGAGGISAGVTPGLGTVLDVGAGPGSVSLALLDSGASKVTACDRSAAALALARQIAGERGLALATQPWDAMSATAPPRGPFDLIAIGHTLNELWAGHTDRVSLRVGLVRRLAEQLASGGRILVMEPALKTTAQEAIQVRDGLVKAGFFVELPCIWQGACPALPDGTCHGEFEWNPLPGMVRLAHAARIGRETLKMAWFILGKRAAAPEAERTVDPDSSPDGGLYRVVSDPLLSKSGRIRYLVCGPQGRFALSASRSIRDAGLSPFFRLARGDGIRFTGARRRETGWGLDKGSTVEVVQRVPRLG